MADIPELYRRMAELTLSHCLKCPTRCATKCCDPDYCAMVPKIANERGEPVPATTGHSTLPYMGPSGCVAPPHLRPLCTLHLCDINSVGFIRKPADKTGRKGPVDLDATNDYFALREEINDAECANVENII